jgi:hypothetical protein
VLLLTVGTPSAPLTALRLRSWWVSVGHMAAAIARRRSVAGMAVQQRPNGTVAAQDVTGSLLISDLMNFLPRFLF